MTLLKTNFAAACLAAAMYLAPTAQAFPTLPVTIDDQEVVTYAVYDTTWVSATTSGNAITFDHNNRFYLSTEDAGNSSGLLILNLLGGSLEYDVDMSQVGCSCLTALYTVTMPAHDNSSDPFQYCDANKVGGHWCPEFDVMEGNKHAFHATGHKCDTPNNGVFNNCDTGGQCTLDILDNNDQFDYGPGSQFKINTLQPFNVKTDFLENSAGDFDGYTITLRQGSTEVEMSTGSCSYLSQMTEDMKRMSIVFSNWSGADFGWMQGDSCSGGCNTDTVTQTFSNISIQTTGEPVVPLDHSSSEGSGGTSGSYEWGDQCGLEACSNQCSDCLYSWPEGTTWQHSDAACRCQASTQGSGGNSGGSTSGSYEWGNTCGLEACSNQCSDCLFSWPEGTTWEHSDAACRCQADTQGSGSNSGDSGDNSGGSTSGSYEWGNACGLEACSNQCSDCLFSWPEGTTWEHSDAACRCQATTDGSGGSTGSSSNELTVMIDGVAHTKYVHNPWWSSSSTDGDKELSFDHNNRMYLQNSSIHDINDYFTMNLLGGIIEFDTDLSTVGCSCLTALYTVTMPGKKNTGDPMYYCDAHAVAGDYCPEFDIMEANMYAFREVGHTCDAPDSNGIFPMCDFNGQCATDILDHRDSNAYGPGSSKTINTQQPFHVKTEVHVNSANQFNGYTTTLSQGSSSVILTTGECNYLNDMTEDMERMVIAISNWSASNWDMQWLQGDSCSGSCNESSVISTFSNISITTADNSGNGNNGGDVPDKDQALVSIVWSASLSATLAIITLAF